MRSQLVNNSIVNSYSEPIVLEGILSVEEVSRLVELFDRSDKTVKNTGPVTVNIDPMMVHESPEILKILSSVEKYIGKFDISAGLFFRVNYPHIIHNDDTWAFPKTYKAITIPLELYGNGAGYPGLCIFDQYYLEGPSKFFNGEHDMKLNYNKGVYEYSEVHNKSESSIDSATQRTILSHIKPQWLEGLSINKVLEWKPGNVMIFDSTKLHCATDFRRLGYTGKLGLSIFTKINDDVVSAR